MKYTDLSIDLETLGTDPGSVITQIGVCAFNDAGEKSVHNFFIDPQSCIDMGLKVSWSTIKWWLMQDEEARTEMVRPGETLVRALIDFNEWIKVTFEGANIFNVWGHGAMFDIGLLEYAYRRTGLTIPWHYRNVRDLRTLIELAGPDVEKPSMPGGFAHVAVDDAVHQAEWILNCKRALVRATPVIER